MTATYKSAAVYEREKKNIFPQTLVNGNLIFTIYIRQFLV